MKCIRRGVFETNSSSTHSIHWSGREPRLINNIDVEDGVVIGEFGEFGWEKDSFISAGVKLSYLLTFVFTGAKDDEDPEEFLKNNPQKMKLYRLVEQAILEHTGYPLSVEKSTDPWFPFGYIDHQSLDIPNDVFEGGVEDIKRFIFDPNVVLYTDNDNS